MTAALSRHWKHRLRSRRRVTGDSGMATAELAAAMPVVVLLLAGALFAVTAARTQIQCVDAARDGALAESRGASGQEVAIDRAPDNAVVDIDTSGDLVTARVTVDIAPWSGWLPGIDVHGEATVAREPGHDF